MAENSKIEWTHHTFNPWRGCTKVSDGCTNCYAETMSGRNPKTLGVWGKYGTRVVASESMWKQPLKWNAAAEKAGERHRVFCASLADVFEGRDTMPEASWDVISEARVRLGWLIKETPNLDWLLLTKRPENVLSFESLGNFWSPDGMPDNVWIGTSVENQEQADKRIPELLKIPAKVRFLSMEPLLGPVNLDRYLFASGPDGEPAPRNEPMLPCLHWVIVGGESGADARAVHPSWVESILDQCQSAEVPFFFKQWGEWTNDFDLVCQAGGDLGGDVRRGVAQILHAPGNPEGYFREGDVWAKKVGKKKAGRLLDGREWNEVPNV